AVDEARRAISVSISNSLEWGIPVLFMRSPDGRIFTVDTRAARATPPTVPPAAPPSQPAPVQSQPQMPVPVPIPKDQADSAPSTQAESAAVQASVAGSSNVPPARADSKH